jgi:hypothetical protein
VDGRDLVQLMRERVGRKLFDGRPNVVESGETFEKAAANLGGVGFACFGTGAEQDRAFAEAFKRQALAAVPYIYALENMVLDLLLAKEKGPPTE